MVFSVFHSSCVFHIHLSLGNRKVLYSTVLYLVIISQKRSEQDILIERLHSCLPVQPLCLSQLGALMVVKSKNDKR